MNASHWIPMVAAVALFGCGLDRAAPPEPAALPSDVQADVARSTDASPFDAVQFVALDLRVRLHESAVSGARSVSPRDHVVVATLADFDGDVVYRGSFGADGRLSTVVALPAEPQDMILRLEAPGFRGRLVEISSMASLSRVSRTMVLEADDVASVSRSDNDRDGVPEAYDADPRDPLVSFVNARPSEGFFSIAFEDMFKRTRAGDADFNDFLADYRVTEFAVPAGVSRIEIEAVGRRKWSGYNHAFGTTMSFEGAASVTVEHFASVDATTPESIETFAIADGPGVELAVIELFHSTRKSVGRRTVATIRFAEPVDPATLTAAPFDPYLYVWNTGYDVHLAGSQSLPRAPHLYEVQHNGPEEAFVDAKGYPFALLVPSSWETPGETQYIGAPFPEFDRWREDLDGNAIADLTE